MEAACIRLSTGPKISVRALSPSGGTSSRMVGKTKKPSSYPPTFPPPPAFTVIGDVLHLFGRPVSEIEIFGHDARALLQLPVQKRLDLVVHRIRQQVHRNQVCGTVVLFE